MICLNRIITGSNFSYLLRHGSHRDCICVREAGVLGNKIKVKWHSILWDVILFTKIFD